MGVTYLTTLLNHSRTGLESIGQLQGGASHDAAEFNAEQMDVNMRELEGEGTSHINIDMHHTRAQCVSEMQGMERI